jgi:TonB family protein
MALQFPFAKTLREVLVFHRRLVALVIALASSSLTAQIATPSIDVSPCSSSTPHVSSEELTKRIVARETITPPMMERLSLHGSVSLRVCVSKKGKVLSAAIIEGHPIARQAVLDSVQKWTFEPYRVDGRAKNVAADLKVNYDFRPPRQSSDSPH